MFRSIVILGALLAAVAAGGCQGFDKKAHNTGNFISGNTEEPIPRPVPDIVNACQQAIIEHNLLYLSAEDKLVEDKSGKKTQTIVTARTREDEKVTFTITPQEKGALLQINTGFLGDTEVRHRLLDSINRQLGFDPKQVAPATEPATQP